MFLISLPLHLRLFQKVLNLQKDLEGHKQGAATLRWKEHRKGFGDKIKKEKTCIFCRARGGRLVITQARGLLDKWRALTFRPAREGGRDAAREAVCHQQ